MRVAIFGLLLVALANAGCNAVRPWERESLARTDMLWNPDPLESALHDHIHFSKEGGMGGGGAGGGGCGCN